MAVRGHHGLLQPVGRWPVDAGSFVTGELYPGAPPSLLSRLLSPQLGKARHGFLTLRQPRLNFANWREVVIRIRRRHVDPNDQLGGGAQTVDIDDKHRDATGDDLDG